MWHFHDIKVDVDFGMYHVRRCGGAGPCSPGLARREHRDFHICPSLTQAHHQPSYPTPIHTFQSNRILVAAIAAPTQLNLAHLNQATSKSVAMARGRPSRAAARRSTPARSATPAQDSDDEMVDAPESRPDTPKEEEEDAESAAPEGDEEEEAPSERSASPVVIHQFPRKKRLGRPPKNRPADWNAVEPDNTSEGGTPIKRKRGRPAGFGRGRPPKGGVPQVTRTQIDKEGTMIDVVNDEADLPEDEEGEQKVDKLGNLQGGRDYRVRIFTIRGRGDRQYMLSTEPARCCGFRDSYLFFTKHMKLHKVIVDDNEKKDLIDREIIPHSYKGRSIGVVTARSVFREFGARIIIGGKRVIDDYYVTGAKEQGAVEGELADPNDRLPPPGEPYNKNQYVAWHGASSVYHTGAPSVPTANGKPVPGKRKVNITSANWQFEHGRAAR